MTSKHRRLNSKIRALAKQLRRNQTDAERMLWNILRHRQVNNIKWRRQHPIGNFIVDFYCAQDRLVVEVDGDSHVFRRSPDERRTLWLKKKGYRVVRFENLEVITNISGVVDRITNVIKELEE